MGITYNAFDRMYTILQNEHIHGGVVLEIGAQQLMGEFDTPKIHSIVNNDRVRGEITRKHTVSDVYFSKNLYEAMNFEYWALDFLNYDHCLSVDLNYETIPSRLQGKCNLVTNFGTSEHVFNQYNCYKTIHDATSKGGLMIHSIPTNGMIDHGLFNTQPNFFLALAVANKYEIISFGLQYNGVHYDILDLDNYKELEKGSAGIWAVMKKNNDAPFVVAQQGNFQNSQQETAHLKGLQYIRKLHELSFQNFDVQTVMNLIDGKKVVFYGAGGNTKALLSINSIRKQVLAVSDRDASKHGSYIHGVEVVSPDKIHTYTQHVIITIDADQEQVFAFINRENGYDLDISFLNLPKI